MFHILGFLFFIILVVLVIGLLILSKVSVWYSDSSVVCKVRIRVSGQLTLLKIISRTLVRKRTTDSYSTQGDVPVRQRKRFR